MRTHRTPNTHPYITLIVSVLQGLWACIVYVPLSLSLCVWTGLCLCLRRHSEASVFTVSTECESEIEVDKPWTHTDMPGCAVKTNGPLPVFPHSISSRLCPYLFLSVLPLLTYFLFTSDWTIRLESVSSFFCLNKSLDGMPIYRLMYVLNLTKLKKTVLTLTPLTSVPVLILLDNLRDLIFPFAQSKGFLMSRSLGHCLHFENIRFNDKKQAGSSLTL